MFGSCLVHVVLRTFRSPDAHGLSNPVSIPASASSILVVRGRACACTGVRTLALIRDYSPLDVSQGDTRKNGFKSDSLAHTGYHSQLVQ